LPIIGFALQTAISLFAPPTSTADPGSEIAAYQASIDQQLGNVDADINNIQTTLQTLLDFTSDVQMQVFDANLNLILDSMVGEHQAIQNQFNDFMTFTSHAANTNSDPNVRTKAITALYNLLTDQASLDTLHNNLLSYQSHVLGSGGSNGVLHYVPLMVQSGWEKCASNVATSANTMEYFGNFYMQQQLDLSGKWYNSVGWVMGQCVTQSFSTLTDSTGRSVKSVFASILVTQLKAYTILRTAYLNDTVNAQRLQDVELAIQAIGNQMADLWAAITVPADVNNYGLTQLKRYAGSTFTPYLNDYFWEFSMQGYNDRNSVANPPGFTLRPATITPSMITTMCVLSDTDSQSFYMMDSQHGGVPCLVDPNAIDWSQLTNAGLAVQNDRSMYVNMPATLLGITRANPTDKKPEFAYQTITDHMLFAPIGAVPLLPDQVVDGFGSDNIAPNFILSLYNAYKGTSYTYHY
jgi:hypothetical protein